MRCFGSTLLIVSSITLTAVAFAQTHGGGGTGGSGGSGRSITSTPTQPRGNNIPVNSPLPSLPPRHNAEEESKVQFHSQTILVQVPIVVIDKSGNHVHGLTKENFRISENGKEQKIATFEEISATREKLPVVKPKDGEFSNLTLSQNEPRTVTVIALDTVNTPFLDQTYGRQQLAKYLAKSIDSGQVLALMIITSRGVKVVQGLTGDTANLVRILDKVSGELPAMTGNSTDAQADAAANDIPDIPSPSFGDDPQAAMDSFVAHADGLVAQFQQQNAIETTMNAFRAIAWSLSGVPGRKSLIWATGGFPFPIGSPSNVPGGYLSTIYERALESLADAKISVYPVDVRGLVDTSPIADVRNSGARSGAALVRQINNRAWLQQSSLETLNDFADMTGGKAFYNTNDLAASFKRAADDASSYYLAGYYLDTNNNHPGWRGLKIKVDHKDVDVRARKGFFVTNATVDMAMTRDLDLKYAMDTPIEGTGIPVTVSWAGITGEGDSKKAAFSARMAPGSLTFDPVEQNKMNFDFDAVAYNVKDGKPAGQVSMRYDKVVPQERLAMVKDKGVGFGNSINLKPGSYNVRFVVRDNVTGKIGSVTAPLTVN